MHNAIQIQPLLEVLMFSGLMQTCTRCRQERAIEYFQAPISMCLLCYAMVKGNKKLTTPQLLEKAKRSRRAKVSKDQLEAQRIKDAVSAGIIAGQMEVDWMKDRGGKEENAGGVSTEKPPVIMLDLNDALGRCERCNALNVDATFDYYPIGQELKMLCPTCAPLKKSIS